MAVQIREPVYFLRKPVEVIQNSFFLFVFFRVFCNTANSGKIYLPEIVNARRKIQPDFIRIHLDRSDHHKIIFEIQSSCALIETGKRT